MSDLIERLRAGTGGGKEWMELHEEAADEIERLRAGLARHVDRVCELTAERDALRARIESSVSGVVLQAGYDESGLARVIVHCSREALSSGPNLIGKRVALVVLEDGE